MQMQSGKDLELRKLHAWDEEDEKIKFQNKERKRKQREATPNEEDQ